jgi:hypothetical protein
LIFRPLLGSENVDRYMVLIDQTIKKNTLDDVFELHKRNLNETWMNIN